MTKFFFGGLTALLFMACATTQVGLKENWIDERDIIALIGVPVSEWMVKAGRPTLAEINGDTAVYYYNYRPTMYAVAVYDSTTFFRTWGTAKENKPSSKNATEVWGSRKGVMQIKVINDFVISAVITEGSDKKSFVRDLYGNIVIDPASGYSPNVSDEQKIDKNSPEFKNAYNSINGKYTWTSKYNPVTPAAAAQNPTAPADTTAAEPQATEATVAPATEEVAPAPAPQAPAAP